MDVFSNKIRIFVIYLLAFSLALSDLNSTSQATNFGLIKNHVIHVKNVTQQAYKLQVHDEFVVKGNNAVFICSMPSFVKEFVQVAAWFKDDQLLISQKSIPNDKFSLLANGELYIRNVSRSDVGFYRCQTKDLLTGQLVTSSTSGKLQIAEPHGSQAPRMTYFTSSIVQRQIGEKVEIGCAAQAFPTPQYSWFRELANGLLQPIDSNGDLLQRDGTLLFHSLSSEDSGKYFCEIRNNLGEERVHTTLLVTRPLRIQLSLSKPAAEAGKDIQLNCSISGSPINNVYWFKDGQPLLINGDFRSLSFKQNAINFRSTDESNIRKDDYASANNAHHNSILTINKVARKDAGVYMCVASNDFENSQASVELQLGDMAPFILSAFTSQTFNENDALNLKCVATGSPLPQIQWFLDAEKVPLTLTRYRLNDFVSQNNHDQVISYLNISKLQSVDSGEYRCMAFNEIGQVSNVARINVFGKPALRTFANINLTLIEGRSVALKCPLVAYPIDQLSWRFNDKQLPMNHRQKIEPIYFDSNGKPNTGRTLHIENIQKSQDEGTYTCQIVQKNGNETHSLEANLYASVKVPPLIDNQLLPEKVYTEDGMRVKLVCSVVQGNSPITIKWLKNGEALLGSSSHLSIQKNEDYSLLTFKQVQENDGSNYSCIASNEVDTAIQSTLLIVNILPKWKIEPPNKLNAVLGSKLIVDCDASGWPRPRISWKKAFNQLNTLNYLNAQSVLKSNLVLNLANEEGPTASKENFVGEKVKLDSGNLEFRDILSGHRHQVYGNGSLIIQEVDKSDEGYFMCQISNGVGAGLSRVMFLKVNVPPFFESKFISVSVKKGEQCVLNCDVVGDLPMLFMWQKDKQQLDVTMDDRLAIVNSNHSQTSGTNVSSKLLIQQVSRLDSALYTCEAKNEFGIDETNIQLIVTEPPEAPTMLEVRDRTSRSITLTFKQPFSGNSLIQKYLIEHRPLGQTNWEKSSKPVLNNGELLFTLKNLKPISDYEIRVSAENALGVGPTSSILQTKTLEEVPAGAPLFVLVEASGAQSLKVKWRAPKKELRFGKILGYYIGYRLVSSSAELDEDQQYNYKNFEIYANTSAEDEPDRQFVTYITNLRAKSLYSIILQAYNSAGTGPRTDPIQQNTLAGSPPITPIAEVLETSFYYALIRWYSASDDRSTVEHLETSFYSLYYRADNDMQFSKKEITPNSSDLNLYMNLLNQSSPPHRFLLGEYKLENLRCGTKYELYMTATNSLGTGEASERVIAKTSGLPPYPPGPLGHFILRNSTSLILRLHKWKSSGCPIRSFRIQYRPENNSIVTSNLLDNSKNMPHRWTILNKEMNNVWSNKDPALLQINHLQPNTIYNVQVQAKSDAGITEEEYIVRTLNRSEAYYESSDDDNNDPGHNEHNIFNPDESAYVYHQFSLLLPITASVFVLLFLVIFMFACFKRQTVQFPTMQLDRFALAMNSNSKGGKDAAFLSQTAHEQLVLSEYQKLNCLSTLNTNSSTLPMDNCSYPDLFSATENPHTMNANQLNSSTMKKYFNSPHNVCDQVNSGLLLNNDNAYGKMCPNGESLYYSSPLRKSSGNLMDCSNGLTALNLNGMNNLGDNLTNGMTNSTNEPGLMSNNDRQSIDPLVGIILKGVQPNHDYAEPYAKQRACLIDSKDMLLLPNGPTFCTNNYHRQENGGLNFDHQVNKSNLACTNKPQQLRMVRINNVCPNALVEQAQQPYATSKRKTTNHANNAGLSDAQSPNLNHLLNNLD